MLVSRLKSISNTLVRWASASKVRARDVALFAAAVGAFGWIAAELDLFGRLSRGAQAHQVDTLLSALLILPIAALAVAMRRLVELKREVARRQQAERDVRALARTDPLTGLPNRRYFAEEMTRRAERLERSGGGLALLHLDLDRFKEINDTLGHAAGDFVLTHAGETIHRALRAEDMVARVGGDEFLIAQDLRHGLEDAERLAERLVTSLSTPVEHEGALCRVGASIGIAAYLVDGDTNRLDPDRLMANADIALYRAKALGRGRFELFSDDLRDAFEARKAMADRLAIALKRGEFEPRYQLQFDAQTRAPVGVEALARWRHPERGLLEPKEFLGVAEEMNLIGEIDAVVLERALRDAERCRFREFGVRRISVNVSAQRLATDAVQTAARRAAGQGVDIAFELTEALCADVANRDAADRLQALMGAGVEIDIDDFGAGRASIAGLIAVQPARVKIDRTLIAPIVECPRQRRLVQAIVDMARTLDVKVVAEGVETERHAAIALDVGCHVLQGEALARPMAPEALAAFLAGGPAEDAGVGPAVEIDGEAGTSAGIAIRATG